MKLHVCIAILSMCSCFAHPVQAAISAFLKPGDPRIYLRGDGIPLERLKGIEATSANGHLGLEIERVTFPDGQSIDSIAPFGPGAFIFQNSGNAMTVVDLLGVTVDGIVPTSFIYPTDIDPTGDLSVSVGIPDSNFPQTCEFDEPSVQVLTVNLSGLSRDPFLSQFTPCIEIQADSPGPVQFSDAIAFYASDSEFVLTDVSLSGSDVFDLPDLPNFEIDAVTVGTSPSDASTFDLAMNPSLPGQYVAGVTVHGTDERGSPVVDHVLSLAALVGTESPADCNIDGSIDIGDFQCARGIATAELLERTNTTPGDLDGAGSVGFADFLTLSANFGGPLIWLGPDLTRENFESY